MKHIVTRRKHIKSANGCTQCKKRRVKCDERFPCRNCTRRHEECDLPDPSKGRMKGDAISYDTPTDWTRDMYLMHHYSQYTAVSLMQRPDVQIMFQKHIPEEAAQYACLQHGLLALSALHLAFLRPYERSIWFPIAFRHQGQALHGFRSTLPELDEKNCHALYALSAVVFMTSISLSGGVDVLSPNKPLPTNDFIEPLLLVHGIRKIHGIAGKWLREGIMAPTLVCHEVPGASGITFPKSIEVEFSYLSGLIRNEYSEPEVMDPLLGALQSLRPIYEEVVHSRGTAQQTSGVIWKWPGTIETGFVTLLRESNSAALVIYAHFAILSEVLENEWFLKGWAERVIQGISHVVDPCWTEALSWPKQQLRKGLTMFNGRE